MSMFPITESVYAGYEDGQECTYCGKYVWDDHLCDDCGGCGEAEAGNGCYEEHHCPNCGNCTENYIHCENCKQCELCAGYICTDCGNCGGCIGDETFCESCGRCAYCMDAPYCFSCHNCASCYSGERCPECGKCEDCTGVQHCSNCHHCADCIGDEVFCESCGECVYCMDAPFCFYCNNCASCNGGDRCDECGRCVDCYDYQCPECGLCNYCVNDEICPNCEVCYECRGGEYCGGCGYCVDCADICPGCGDACSECGTVCENCGYCENCAEICPGCGEACSECAEVCGNCGLCEDCTDICPGCEDSCSDCANVCENCGYCEDCAYICIDCGEVCSECGEICQNCQEYCSDCKKFCLDCGSCEECVQLCPICEEYCADCVTACETCGACEHCETVCPTCNSVCSNCGDVCPKCGECSYCSGIYDNYELINGEYWHVCSCGYKIESDIIPLDYEIEEETAKLKIDSKKVEEIANKSKDGEAIIDASKKKEVTSAEVPKETVSALADKGLAVSVKLPTGTMTLDKAAATSILKQGKEELGDIKMELKRAATNNLTESQKSAIKDGDLLVDINIFVDKKKVTEFDGHLTMKMPYNGPQPVVVHRLTDDGKLEKVDSSFKNGILSFNINHLSFYVIGKDPTIVKKEREKKKVARMVFTDVPESAWYFKDVEKAYKNKLVDGKSPTLYKPNDNISFSEAVKLAACMQQLYTDKKVSLKNGEEIWYSTYMDYAVKNKIIDEKAVKGREREIIRRKEFVDIFYNALPKEEYKGINTVKDNAIPDVKIKDKYADKIYAFYKAGILTGSDDKGSFRPDSNIQRSEVAAILTRMFEEKSRKNIEL